MLARIRIIELIETHNTEGNKMTKQYISNDDKVVISIRQKGKINTAWALHVDGKYQGSKVLPNNNTAIVQNFGYSEYFTQ
jgi:hypothetical protein